jgi:hypothetical protein
MPFFDQHSSCAPHPTITDIGVANPKSTGQAIIKTATALIKPNQRIGSGPNFAQQKNEHSNSHHYGTKYLAILSASFEWVHERLASLTICTIWDRVSEPIFCYHYKLIAVNCSSNNCIILLFIYWNRFSEIIDSSMVLCPSVILPSTGIFSPGFTQ